MGPFDKVIGKTIKSAKVYEEYIEIYYDNDIQLKVFAKDHFGPTSSFHPEHLNMYEGSLIKNVYFDEYQYVFLIENKKKKKMGFNHTEYILRPDGLKEITSIERSIGENKIKLGIADFNDVDIEIVYTLIDGKWILSEEESHYVDDEYDEEYDEDYDENPTERFRNLISYRPEIEKVNLLEHPLTRTRILAGRCGKLY